MKIALRETKESRNSLHFLVHCRLTPHWERLLPLEDEAKQLSKIFAVILLKVKRRYAAEQAERRNGGKRQRPELPKL